MWKKLVLCALLTLLLLSIALAESELLQDLQNLDPEDFAQKYITATQNGPQLYAKLVEELGDFDFWPLIYKKRLHDTWPHWERWELELQGKTSGFGMDNPIFYFEFANPNSIYHVSEEEAKEKALAWAVEKGLLSQADLPTTKVATFLVTGDYFTGKYPSPMWNIRLHGAGDEPIEVWLSAMSGKLPKHTSAQVLAKGREVILAQMEEGQAFARKSDSTGFIPATPEDVKAWYGFAVYLPSRGQWRTIFDNGNSTYYWVTLYDADLRNEEVVGAGNG